MVLFVLEIRSWGYRTLPDEDDFLTAPSPFVTSSTTHDCENASPRVDNLLQDLYLFRQLDEGCWGAGTWRIHHLGMIIDSQAMTFDVTPRKAEWVKQMSKQVLK